MYANAQGARDWQGHQHLEVIHRDQGLAQALCGKDRPVYCARKVSKSSVDDSGK